MCDVNYIVVDSFIFLQHLELEIIPSTFEENLDKSKFSHPSQYVKENSKQKSLEVFGRLQHEVCPFLFSFLFNVLAWESRKYPLFVKLCCKSYN